MSGAEGRDIAITKVYAHVFVADKGRIADHKVSLRPSSTTWIDKIVNWGACIFIGHILTGNGMLRICRAVPTGLRLAMFIPGEFFFVISEDGVAAFDVVEFFEDGLGGHGFAVGAEVPLEVADPEDQIGDGGGAGVDFDAAELVGIDGEAGVFEGELGVGELGEKVIDFAFEAFHVFEGDVEKVAAAAGGIEDRY